MMGLKITWHHTGPFFFLHGERGEQDNSHESHLFTEESILPFKEKAMKKLILS